MTQTPDFVQLHSESSTLLVDCTKRTPAIIYYGKKLSNETTGEMLQLLSTRQEAKCSVVIEAPISLSPLLGQGFTGAPGIEVVNNDIAWSLGGDLISVTQQNDQEVVFVTVDSIRHIKVIHTLTLNYASNVLASSTELVNLSEQPLMLGYCAAPTIPMTDQMNKIMSFEGRWSHEFQRNTIDLFLGSFVRENRKGKTSHDNFPGLVMHNEYTHENQGECYGFHLGWSGNNKLRSELLPEGRSYVQLGELLLPGEVELNANESYKSPTLYSAYSANGFNEMSQCFHKYVRANILRKEVTNKPRPVHYNTWEGIYFDHDVDTLKDLAERASKLGAERFVLDDGWFKGRRGDYAGLGDWVVDTEIYPNGLQPLIDHVNSCGMEFGLWFEPEMVNPDSDLYRAHPDWVLQTEGNEHLPFRNQLVLDFTRQEVTDLMFKMIDDILVEYPKIEYIKWDMNRDINHAGGHNGKPAIHKQTQALYKIIARLKAKHPSVEIESCSSGGARVDYGVLQHTDRVWTSDSNDALDRLSIQRGCSYFFPSNVMGAHVGPRDCHITGKHVSVEMRAGVAFFGHMGIEMDPRELTEHEKEQLTHVIALHKKHREFIHNATLIRANSDGDSVDFGLVNDDKTKALFSYNSVNETKRTTPKKYRFNGLKSDQSYKLALIWPTTVKDYSPSILSKIQNQVFTGESLMQFGMQLPVSFPQTTLIFELNQV